MNYRVIIQIRALTQLDEQYGFIAKENSLAAAH